MTDDPGGGAGDLDTLDRFLAAYAAAADPAAELDRWAREHPRLADEFRLLAAYGALAALRVPAAVAGVELLGPVGRGGTGLVYEGVESSGGRWRSSCARRSATRPAGTGSWPSAGPWPGCTRRR